jgi:hypothetical protein
MTTEQNQVQNLLSFGQAIEALKQGKIVARNGWNGKGMFIFLNKGNIAFNSPHVTDDTINGPIEGVSAELFNIGDYGTVTRLPNLNMRAATGSTVTGWLASQTDILSEDWCIVELNK